MPSDEDVPVFIYATFADVAEARAIGGALVESALAACVNIFPGMESIYRWQGAVESGEETAMLIKTRAGAAEAAMAAVRERHSYDTPALVVLPTAGGSTPYLDWIVAETAAPEKDAKGR